MNKKENNKGIVIPVVKNISIDDFPSNLRKKINEKTINSINDKLARISVNPDTLSEITNNFINYLDIIQTGKYTIEQYLNAVIYVSHKISGLTQIESYKRTFPDRYKKLIDDGRTREEITKWSHTYNNTQLVVKLEEQLYIPIWILNQPYQQKAINKLVLLMDTAKSEMVQFKAAESLVNYLKRPEALEYKIDVNHKQDTNILESIENHLEKLAINQRQSILEGTKTSTIAKDKFIEYEDITDI